MGQNDPMITVYGIPNCSTVKNARAWLTEHGVAHTFHDFKKAGVPADALPHWVAQVGWQRLINRAGPTWRKLDPSTQAAMTDPEQAAALLQTHASVIKRPLVQWANGDVTVGFAPEDWAQRV